MREIFRNLSIYLSEGLISLVRPSLWFPWSCRRIEGFGVLLVLMQPLYLALPSARFLRFCMQTYLHCLIPDQGSIFSSSSFSFRFDTHATVYLYGFHKLIHWGNYLIQPTSVFHPPRSERKGYWVIKISQEVFIVTTDQAYQVIAGFSSIFSVVVVLSGFHNQNMPPGSILAGGFSLPRTTR